MKRNYFFKRLLAAVLMVVTMAASVTVPAYASNNIDIRRRVVGAAGIMSVGEDMNRYVTRSEFARMLVKASQYRDIITTTSNISIFADVQAGNEFASAIRICAEQAWMTAFLGGKFKPDQPVSLCEAEKGLLGLLGYKNEDFPGDQYNMRHAKASALSITENVEKGVNDLLTATDCVHLFYNLLRCKTTDNRDYVTVLGGKLASDGEVDATSFATDTSLKGPKFFVGDSGITRLNQYIPFAINDGSVYINGKLSNYDSLKSEIIGAGAVVYYNASARTIWAYSCDTTKERGGKGAIHGKIEGILYNGPDTLTPSGVSIDGMTFKLATNDMQFAFSIYGSCKVGETVTLIYTVENENGESEYEGTVVDYVYGSN